MRVDEVNHSCAAPPPPGPSVFVSIHHNLDLTKTGSRPRAPSPTQKRPSWKRNMQSRLQKNTPVPGRNWLCRLPCCRGNVPPTGCERPRVSLAAQKRARARRGCPSPPVPSVSAAKNQIKMFTDRLMNGWALVI